jgi:hypothetical protein
MDVVLMQGGKLICCHSKLHVAILIYPMYDKDLYDLVYYVKKWKHYFLGKEIVIHTNHQSLQYFRT